MTRPTAPGSPDPPPVVASHGAFDTVQAAYDEAPRDRGVSIELTGAYDPSAESYPIALHADGDDFAPFALRGQGPSVTRIGHDDVGGDVLSIRGAGPAGYSYPFTIENLRVHGGEGGAGIAVESSPQGIVDTVVLRTKGHGVRVGEGEHGSYGTTFSNVQAWNCGGDGFRLDSGANPHSTHFYGCRATACRGVGFRLRGYKTAIHGGTVQLCHSHGIDVRSPAVSIRDAYVEGNGRREDHPVEVYGDGAHGLSVSGCYFHGATPRRCWHDRDCVLRAVNLHGSKGVAVRDCVYRRYGDRFFKGFGCERAALYDETHVALDGTPLR
ncbi:right-handed parallel beta-helix repeat-containing protein [Halegenticoccus soli]|uniref:right-handed parallel beta-helix repeat-containing protein n=1 Tax=Halegenticoccus soli TaxID=1985678 RepID=UPI000C6E932F|nr:right-handed parallel beta-helix repeat-containing protein [Halegenticoccus soli]